MEYACIYTEEGNKNPVEIAENAIRYAKTNHYDLVIVDTAGRLAVDEQMMREIAAIKEGREAQRDSFRGRLDDRSGCCEYST